MTSSLAHARPDQVMRAAALLGASADELGRAVSACRRSADVQWVGRPNEQYQGRLAELGAGLSGVRTAFDSGCEALLDYARALAWAQPLAEEAARLGAVPAGEALMDRAMTLRATAEEAEAAAAARLVAVLQDLADRAPRVSGWTTAGHHAANFAQGLDDAVKGIGSTFLAAVHSLPGVGTRAHRAEARHQVVQTVEDTLQPWKQVQELYDALTDGHAWYVGGQTAGAALFRFRHLHGKQMDLYGGHDELPDNVMLALRRGAAAGDLAADAWLLDRLRADFVQALLRFEHKPLPVLDELMSDGVDLVRHEARDGGHTLQRHVGRDADFLRLRQQLERHRDGSYPRFSSFATIDAAEAAVNAALRANFVTIEHWVTASTDPSLKVTAPISAAGTLIDSYGLETAATQVVMRLVKDESGRVLVASAYLD